MVGNLLQPSVTAIAFFCFSLDQRKSREKALKKELLALRRQMTKERRSRGSGEINSIPRAYRMSSTCEPSEIRAMCVLFLINQRESLNNNKLNY